MHDPTRTPTMALCCVATWLQESGADSQVPPETGVDGRMGFSYAKVGEFRTRRPLVAMPALAEKPKLQPRSKSWVDSAMAHPYAWRQLWPLVCNGFYLTAATGMQHLEEAGVQTLLASVLVGFPTLLGNDIKLRREEVLKGSERKGPIEFTFKSSADVITAVVEAKTPVRMEGAYAASVEQLYAEMYAAWEHNSNIGQEGQPVTGMLVDGVGALMFQLNLNAAAVPLPATATPDGDAATCSDTAASTRNVQGSIVCSGYLCLFNTGMAGLPTPGPGLGIWMCTMLVAVLPECCKWESSEWEARVSSVTEVQVAWSKTFTRILDAMQSL